MFGISHNYDNLLFTVNKSFTVVRDSENKMSLCTAHSTETTHQGWTTWRGSEIPSRPSCHHTSQWSSLVSPHWTSLTARMVALRMPQLGWSNCPTAASTSVYCLGINIISQSSTNNVLPIKKLLVWETKDVSKAWQCGIRHEHQLAIS